MRPSVVVMPTQRVMGPFSLRSAWSRPKQPFGRLVRTCWKSLGDATGFRFPGFGYEGCRASHRSCGYPLHKMIKKRRPSARAKRQNSLACAFPPAIIDKLIQRKVQKGGSVTLSSDLRPGIRVNVARIDESTFVVSSRPAPEIQTILRTMPKRSTSPFAALSERLRGQAHDIPATRSRPAFTAAPIVPEISDEQALSGAIIRRSERTRGH